MIAVTKLAVSAATIATAWVGPILPAPNPEPARPVPVQAVPAEDSPEWDCETMGNRACGRVEVNLYHLTPDGPLYVQIYDERDREVFTAAVENVIDER